MAGRRERRRQEGERQARKGSGARLEHHTSGTASPAVRVLLQWGVTSVGVGRDVSSVGFGGRGGVGVLSRARKRREKSACEKEMGGNAEKRSGRGAKERQEREG